LFSVSNDKGSVGESQQSTVGFTFTPPPTEVTDGGGGGGGGGGVGTRKAVDDVGQWLEVVAVLSVKSGYVPEGTPDTKRVRVVLRGYVAI